MKNVLDLDLVKHERFVKYYKYFKQKAAGLWQRMQATPKETETRS